MAEILLRLHAQSEEQLIQAFYDNAAQGLAGMCVWYDEEGESPHHATNDSERRHRADHTEEEP